MIRMNKSQDQIRQMKEGGGSNQGVIPTDTKIRALLSTSGSGLNLVLQTSNYSVIRGAVIRAEHLFEGESLEAKFLYCHPAKSTVELELKPKKNVVIKMHIAAFAGVSGTSTQYHVFEVQAEAPKFAMFHFVLDGHLRKPQGNVKLKLGNGKRPSEVWQWIARSFLNVPVGPNQKISPDSPVLAQFVSLRSQKALIFESSQEGQTLTIFTDELELAADLLEDLYAFLKIPEQESVADFPEELSDLGGMLAKIEGHNSTRLKQTADIADSSNLVKALVVKAEDYRILGGRRGG